MVHHLRVVVEVESLGKLEVELNGGTLMRSLQRIHDHNVDLGAVECTVSWVQLPRVTKFLQRLLQLLENEDGGGSLQATPTPTPILPTRLTASALSQSLGSPMNFSGLVER